jgi:hypothetical protein
VTHSLNLPSLASDEQLVSDRSLAVFAELACIVRAGGRIVDTASEALMATDAPLYHHSKLTTMLQARPVVLPFGAAAAPCPCACRRRV